MTDNPQNQADVPQPAGYRREDYLSLLPLFESGKLPHVYADHYGGIKGDGIYKRQTPKLPEDKRDINDVSRSIVRLSMPGRNYDWPEGDVATRKRIFDEHLRHNVGMLFFLQNDEAVPARFREKPESGNFVVMSTATMVTCPSNFMFVRRGGCWGDTCSHSVILNVHPSRLTREPSSTATRLPWATTAQTATARDTKGR